MLTCMDYRLVDDVHRYLDGRGLTDRYDHVVLAGASLGAVTELQPDWGATFWQHVDVAIALHHIRRIIVIDHRDCGAYRVLLGADIAGDPAQERRVHAEQLARLAAMIGERHPDLAVELLLMALDGTVETVAG